MTDRMRILTADGPKWVDVESYSDASDIGTYWNAVRKFVNTGDDSGLWAFEGEFIGVDELLTDLDDIEYWAQVGELEFEDIYEGD
jgi:soluble cytochrome b562